MFKISQPTFLDRVLIQLEAGHFEVFAIFRL